MENLVKDLLENVVERLAKIETQQEAQVKKESRIDQVIERLDTLQNYQAELKDKLFDISTKLEQEKLFINDQLSTVSTQLEQEKVFIKDHMSTASTQLEQEKVFIRDQLSTISTQLEDEKVFMRDQLKEAQDEILHRLTELQQQNVSTRSQAVSVGEEMKQLQATAGPNPVKETAEFCSQADGDVMDARLAKMSETLEQSVKAVTRAELALLGNQTDQRISELSNKVDELGKDTLKTVESIKRENKDMATELKIDLSEEFRAQNEKFIKEVQESLTEMVEKNRNSITQQREDMKTFYTEIVTQVKKTSAELPRTLDEVKKEIKDHMETVKGESIADTNTAILKPKDHFIGAQNQMLQNVQEQTETEVKESMEKVTDEPKKGKEERLKNTKFACFTLKESVDKVDTYMDKTVFGRRHGGKIPRLLPHDRLYIYDFYIQNFRLLVKSGETVTSKDWPIKPFCTSVRGNVFFSRYDDEMRACLGYSKYHSDLGSQLKSGVTLRITVTITDTSGQLRDVLMGQKIYTWEEKDIKKGEHWCKLIANKLCNTFLKKGYGQKEGYRNGALLLRYQIEVISGVDNQQVELDDLDIL